MARAIVTQIRVTRPSVTQPSAGANGIRRLSSGEDLAERPARGDHVGAQLVFGERVAEGAVRLAASSSARDRGSRLAGAASASAVNLSKAAASRVTTTQATPRFAARPGAGPRPGRATA